MFPFLFSYRFYFVAVLNSPRYPDSVFAIFDTVANGGDAVGTCFSVSPKYLISCQHFMKGNHLNYRIALTAERSQAGGITFPAGIMDVKVYRRNKDMDYAILELKAEPYNLVPIPISIDPVVADTDVKVFHFPVAEFNDTSTNVVGPYTQWIKTSIPTAHHIPCGGPGLYRGSSGAPFVSRSGSVVGIHMEAASEAAEVNFAAEMDVDSKIDVISNTVNSNANVHGSRNTALQIGKCDELVTILRKLGIIN